MRYALKLNNFFVFTKYSKKFRAKLCFFRVQYVEIKFREISKEKKKERKREKKKEERILKRER